MRDEEEAIDGPPDSQLHPEQSLGFDVDPVGLEGIEVDRDVTIGEVALADLGASDTEPVEDYLASDLLVSLAGDGVVERQRAALALAEREGNRVVVEALPRAVTTDEDAEVRQFAVEALAKHGGDLAAETARTLTDDPDPWVRAEIVVALDRLDRGEHEAVIEAALDDEHYATRRNAFVPLFKLRGEGACDALVATADDPSERVREWAAHLLDGVETDRVAEVLSQLADDERSVVRETAARARKVDSESFRRQFTGVLDETDRTLPGEDDLNRTPNL